MKGWRSAGGFLLAGLSLRAASAPAGADLHGFEARAATLFNASALTGAESPLLPVCDRVLLCCQAGAVLLIIAALLLRIRDERTQMEGVAATLLKVAFIALVPELRDVVIGTADTVASSIGFASVAVPGAPPAATSDVWRLLEEWAPPGTPYLDVLEAQNGDNAPASGSEQVWGLQAWNWARGVGAANASIYHALWQTASGSIRATIVFGCCGAISTLLSLAIMLAYLGEVLRVALFYGGCALLPLCIAGLALDSMRAASFKFIVGMITVAFWPVAWGVANVVTHFLAGGVTSWIREVTASVMQGAGLTPTSLAVSAPYLGWGVLFLFAGVTLAVFGWCCAATFYAPLIMSRAFNAGAQFLGHAVSAMTAPRAAAAAASAPTQVALRSLGTVRMAIAAKGGRDLPEQRRTSQAPYSPPMLRAPFVLSPRRNPPPPRRVHGPA